MNEQWVAPDMIEFALEAVEDGADLNVAYAKSSPTATNWDAY